MATAEEQGGRQPQEADGGPAIGMPAKRQKVSAEGAAVHDKLENGRMCPRRCVEKRNAHAEAVSRKTCPAEPATTCKTPNPGAPTPREKNTAEKLGSEEHSTSRMDHNLQVIIRVRPLSSVDIAAHGQVRCVRQDSDNVLTWLGHPEARFTFDYVACESIPQHKFFFLAGLPMVDSCISGYNCSLFTYGETGSGKTHTMIGDLGDLDSRSSSRGIIPRMFGYLFARIQQDQEARSLEHLQYSCKCSYLEIHGDQIRDLLQPTSGNLQKGDAERRLHVENLTGVEVFEVPDVIQLLLQGSPSKKGEATTIDGEDMESHSIFTCLIESKWQSDSIINTTRVRLNLVELADPDRQKSSGECLNISESFSTLGLVLSVLLDKNPCTVPCCHSKSTHFLQDSLGSHSKMTLVANVNPSVCSAMKTLSTLRFAQSAKSILKNDIVGDAPSDSVSLSNIESSKELAAAQAEVIRLKTSLWSVNNQKEIEWDEGRRKLSKELQTAKDKLLEAASVMKALLTENQKLKSDGESWHAEALRLSGDEENYKASLGIAEEKVNAIFTALKSALQTCNEEIVSGTFKAETCTYPGGTTEEPLPKEMDNLSSSETNWTDKLELLLNTLSEVQTSVSLLEAERDTAKFERSTVKHEAQIAAMQTLERHRLELGHMQSLASKKSCEVKILEEKLRQVEHEAEESSKRLEEAHKKIDDVRKQHDSALADTKRAGFLRLERLQFQIQEAQSLANKRTSEVEELERKLGVRGHDLQNSQDLLQVEQMNVENARKRLESERSEFSAKFEQLKAASTLAGNEANMSLEKLSAAQAQVEDLNNTLISVQAGMRQREMEWEEKILGLRSQLQESLARFSQQEKKWVGEMKNLELELQQVQIETLRTKDAYAVLTYQLQMTKSSLLEAERAHKQELVSVDKEKQVFVSKFNSTQETCSALELEVQRVTSLYTGMEEQLSKTKDDWRKDREHILAASKAAVSTKEIINKKPSEVQQLEGKIVQLELSLRGAQEELEDTAEVWDSEKSQLTVQLEHFKAATSTTRNEAIVLTERLLATQGELKDLGNTLVALQAKSTGRERAWQEESASLKLQLQQGKLNASRIKDEAAALQARAASLDMELDKSMSCLAQAKDLHHQALVSWDEEKENLLSKLRVATAGNERCSALELEVQRLHGLLASVEHRLSKTEEDWTKDSVQLEAARRALASATASANEKTSEARILKENVVLLEQEVLNVSNLLTGVQENMEIKTGVWKCEKAQLSLELEQFKARVTSLSAELELTKEADDRALLIREREKQDLLHRLDAAQDASSGLELELKRVTSLFAETEQRLSEAQISWMKEREKLALQLAERNTLLCSKLSECNQLKSEVTRYESYMSNLHSMLLAAKKSNRVKDTKWNKEREKLALQLQQAEHDNTRKMDDMALLLSRVESLEGELSSLKGSRAGSEHCPEQDMTETLEKGIECEKERLKDLAAGIKDNGPDTQTVLQRTRHEILRIEARIRKLEEKRHSRSTPSKKGARASMHLSTAPSTTSSFCPLSFNQGEIIVLHSHFHAFDNDRTEKEIVSNQIWAIYEEHDGMPRRYGQILEVQISPFKAVMRWLVPILTKQGKAWVAFTGMALSCGDFHLGKQRVVDNVNIFSHMMLGKGGTDVIRIYPRKHDVWALYQTSDNKWPDARKEGTKQAWYDIVEVMNDFSEEAGAIVTPLSKVSGFRTLFQQSPSLEDSYCTKDLLRFSHKVPAHRMSGNEAAGVPKDCLELDPASIPLDMICG